MSLSMRGDILGAAARAAKAPLMSEDSESKIITMGASCHGTGLLTLLDVHLFAGHVHKHRISDPKDAGVELQGMGAKSGLRLLDHFVQTALKAA
jgi:hypothetical protein